MLICSECEGIRKAENVSYFKALSWLLPGRNLNYYSPYLDFRFETYFGRSRNIGINLKERGCEDINWIQLVQNKIQWWALVITVMKTRQPIKGGDFLDHLSNHQLLKKESTDLVSHLHTNISINQSRSIGGWFLVHFCCRMTIPMSGFLLADQDRIQCSCDIRLRLSFLEFNYGHTDTTNNTGNDK
jgi:hypothetical protein